jgi:5-oxoprolinase (ATP-hydrolysing) subunit A
VAREHVIDGADGRDVPTNAPTVCIHGDGPNAVEIARTVKAALAEAGVEMAPLGRTLRREPSVGTPR